MNNQNEATFPYLVKQLKDNLLAHIEYTQLNAKIERAKYEALVKEGFTEQQSLELCK